eukprot:5719455-Ditylum_brightwellii.AAC.1
MSTAASTMAQVNKRAWFEESTLATHKSTTTRKRQLPKALVLDYILGKTVLLHPTIKNNLITL